MPAQTLAISCEALAKGRLGQRLPVASGDEFVVQAGQLVSSRAGRLDDSIEFRRLRVAAHGMQRSRQPVGRGHVSRIGLPGAAVGCGGHRPVAPRLSRVSFVAGHSGLATQGRRSLVPERQELRVVAGDFQAREHCPPGLEPIGMVCHGLEQNVKSLAGSAASHQGHAKYQARAHRVGLAARRRLEPCDQRGGVGGFNLLTDDLDEKTHAVTGVGLDLVLGQGEALGLVVALLEVVEIQQSPGRLRHEGIEAQGVQPACLGLVVALLEIKRLSTGDAGPRQQRRFGRVNQVEMLEDFRRPRV